MKQYHSFFMDEVPKMLKNLREDTAPGWGTMDASAMIDHLRKGIEVSLVNVDGKVITPEERLPAYKQFLMSDKLFRPGEKMPDEFDKIPDHAGSLEDRKMDLMKSLVKLQLHFENNPGFTSIHSYFGVLNTEEWLHLHRKHILHHFRQFQLTGNGC